MAKRLELPVGEEAVRALHAGDEVLLSGRVVTAREAAHKHLLRAPDPALRALLEGRVIYHCVPVAARDPETRGWRLVAAGAAPSMRVEAWQADVIAAYGARGVLGRGGMGPRTLAALKEHGAVYLHAPDRLATGLARHVVKVHGVHLLDELGVSEAIWDVEVKDLPAVVTMDAHGESLHARTEGGGDPAA
jgi:fumarate hydratase subunit beta